MSTSTFDIKEKIERSQATELNDDGQKNFIVAEKYYHDKSGYPKGLDEALKYYKISAALNYAPAKAKLGYLCQAGIGVPSNIKVAIDYYKEAAAVGNDDAECRLGYCYQNGVGVEKDEATALRFFNLSANKGNQVAQYYLAKFYENEGPNQDIRVAKGYYQKAIDGGYDFAKSHLLALTEKYPLLKIVKGIDDEGQKNFTIAEKYYYDKSGYPKGLDEALKYYKISAAFNYAPAKAKLGYLYQVGIGVPNNIKIAIDYYKVATAIGNDDAECRLGYCYQNGVGVEKDETIALKFFNLSANKGNQIAQYYLAKFYEKEGVNQDIRAAESYYQKAIDGGYDFAKSHLLALLKKYPQLKSETVKNISAEADKAKSLIQRANQQKKQDHKKNAIEDYTAALKIMEEIYGQTSPELLSLLVNLKDTYEQSNQALKAKALQERIKTIHGKEAYEMAEKYFHGKDGVEKNFKNAVSYYKAAVANDNSEAQTMLGYLYLQGKCDGKSTKDAVELFLTAVAQNNPKALFFLGYCYLNGLGIDKSEAQALKFLKLAENQGIQDAPKLLNTQNMLAAAHSITDNGEIHVNTIEKPHHEGLQKRRPLPLLNQYGDNQPSNNIIATYESHNNVKLN